MEKIFHKERDFPSITEIAARVGVSPATVSKALNGKPGVRPELRRKILEEATKLGYLPHIKARAKGLYRIGADYILWIFPKITGHLAERTLEGAGGQFANLRLRAPVNWEVLMSISMDPRLVAIVFAFHVPPLDLVKILMASKPVYLFNSYSPYLPSVYVDERSSTRELVAGLLKKGYNRIGLLIAPGQKDIWEQRLAGYEDALLFEGIKPDASMIAFEDSFSVESSSKAAESLLKLGADCIVAGSDYQAYGVLMAMKKRGVKPPKVGLAGFDDLPADCVLEPPLTSVRQPLEEMASFLVKQIKAGKRDSKVFEARIIWRESTSKL